MWSVRVLEWAELTAPWRDRLRDAVEEALDHVPGEGRVVVDERCPGLDAATLHRMLAASAADGQVRLGVRAVTDTVKRVRDGRVAGTVDRSGLVQAAGPLVVPEAHLGHLTAGDLVEAASRLAQVTAVVTTEVPGLARRLDDATELRLLW